MENLKIEVSNYLNEIDRTHRYNLSTVYSLGNKVFNTDDNPNYQNHDVHDTRRRIERLKQWIKE